MGNGHDVFQRGCACDSTFWWLQMSLYCSAVRTVPLPGSPRPAGCTNHGERTQMLPSPAAHRLPPLPGLGPQACPSRQSARASPQPQCPWPQDCLCLPGHLRPSHPVSAIYSESILAFARKAAAGRETGSQGSTCRAAATSTIQLGRPVPRSCLGTFVVVTTQGSPGLEWMEARDCSTPCGARDAHLREWRAPVSRAQRGEACPWHRMCFSDWASGGPACWECSCPQRPPSGFPAASVSRLCRYGAARELKSVP